MKNGITVTALARRAGVGRRTARDWLKGERNTQQGKETALEAAFTALGGSLLKQPGGEAAFLDAVLAMGARRAVKP